MLVLLIRAAPSSPADVSPVSVPGVVAVLGLDGVQRLVLAGQLPAVSV